MQGGKSQHLKLLKVESKQWLKISPPDRFKLESDVSLAE